MLARQIKRFSRHLLYLSLAAALLATMLHERTFYDDLSSFYSNPYPLRDDDRDYFYIAQSFWGIPHDPNLTEMPESDGKFFKLYPMRGIGAGTPMVALFSLYGFEWRKVFVLALSFFHLMALSIGALGFYFLFGNGFFSLVFVLAAIKFSPGTTPDMIQGAEGIVKTFLLWNISALILLLGLIGTNKKITRSLIEVFLFLGIIYITLVKTQWWIGPFLASLLFMTQIQSRRVGLVLLFSCLTSFGLVRGINYFHYDRNTEFFSSSGLMSLRLARGQEIVTHGCAKDLFPPNSKAYFCASPPRTYTWHEVIRNIEPMSEVVSLAEITGRIDRTVLINQWPQTIKRFWEQSSTAFIYLVSPRQEDPNVKKILLCLFIFPLFFFWLKNNFNLKALALLSIWIMTLLPFFASTLVAPWIERYAGPICLYFYLVPLMAAADLILNNLLRADRFFSIGILGNHSK